MSFSGMAATLKLLPTVALQWSFITLLDYAPRFVKRRVLAGEYTGAALERRLGMRIGGGWRMFQALLRMAAISGSPAVPLGGAVPPGIWVYELDQAGSVQPVDLATWPPKSAEGEACKEGTPLPLVLNFGSCTWPPFMGALAGFASMVGDYAGRANFAVVYLEEAHPTDGWLYGAVEHFIPQHATLAARQAAAQVLRAELLAAWVRLQLHPGGDPSAFPCSVLVDGMGNAASLAFGALPERLAVLAGGELRWLGGKGPENYSLLTARDALDTLLASGGAPAWR